MSNFWPSDIELSDTQSPKEILKVAQEDWHTSSNGAMELVLQDTTSRSGNSMIIVHAKYVTNNRTSTLFSVVHRPTSPYPVTIQPKDEDLPNFLKKSYYQQGLVGIGGPMQGMEGREVSNQWVSDSPFEFRKKLAEVFNLGVIKSRILNLAVSTIDDSDKSNGESQEDLAEN